MRKITIVSLFGVGFVMSLAACSSEGKSDSDVTSGSNELNRRSDPAAQADALVERGRRAMARRNSTGQIALLQSGHGVVSFASYRLYKDAPPAACQGRKFGACEVILSTDCPDEGEFTRVNAGTLTFRSDDPKSRNYPVGSDFFTLPAAERFGSADGYFDIERVRVHAAGDPKGVPAFTAQLDLPPPGMILTSPTIEDEQLADTKKIDLDRSKAMAIAWRPMPEAGKHPGKVNVFLVGNGTATATEDGGITQISPDVYIECNFDAKTGAGEIPAEAMATMPVGPGSIDFKLVADRPVPGIERVILRGQSDMARPDGTPITWKGFDNMLTR